MPFATRRQDNWRATNSAAYLLDQLCSCVLKGVFQLNCSGNRDSIVDDQR